MLSVNEKEKIHDSRINPLMDQIIEICKENKIAFLADFCFGHEEDGSVLKSTSCLLEDEYDPDEGMIHAIGILYRPT